MADVLHHVPGNAFSGPDAVPDPFKVPQAELERRRKLPAVVFSFGLLGPSLFQPLWDTTAGWFGPSPANCSSATRRSSR